MLIKLKQELHQEQHAEEELKIGTYTKIKNFKYTYLFPILEKSEVFEIIMA